MTANLTFGTADITILAVLAVGFILGIRMVIGFFKDKK